MSTKTTKATTAAGTEPGPPKRLTEIRLLYRTPLRRLTRDERDFLEVCLTVYRGMSGGLTASEDMLGRLLTHYGFRGRITAKEANEELADFNAALASDINDARRFIRQYREMFPAQQRTEDPAA